MNLKNLIHKGCQKRHPYFLDISINWCPFHVKEGEKMANETEVGSLTINLKMKLEGLEKGLETAKKKLQSIEQENKNMENSNKSLDASFIAMSATAVLALNKIVGVIKDCVNEYNSYTQAMSSLQNVSEYTGESMQDFSKIMSKFGAYMTKADLATTIKNFSLMGMSAQETEKMIEALTNSAIRNRNANYTVSEAVRVASEGYRQGLSTLSDSAGVTENLSVMLDNYAKSIGKTASQLTEAEKNQAYLNRTMYAAEPFASAMSDYLETLAGKQGQYSQAMRETQVAYAEALEPILVEMTGLKMGLIKILGNLISNNKAATAGTTAFIATVMTAIIAVSSLTLAKKAYATATGIATMSTKAFTAALLANPITAVIAAIASFVGILAFATTAANEQAQAQANLSEETERYKKILEGTYGYTEKEISEAEQAKARIEEQIDLLQKQIDKQNEINKLKEEAKKFASYGEEERKSDNNYKNYFDMADAIKVAETQLKNIKKQYKEAIKDGKEMGKTIEELEQKLEPYNEQLKKSNAFQTIKKALDIEIVKNQQKEAAQLKLNADTMQNYLNVVKKGQKSTTEYQNAVKELAKIYPEAASAEGILIDVAQDYINTAKTKAEQDWNASQTTIKGNIDVINKYKEMVNAAKENEVAQKQLAESIGIAYENIIPTLNSTLNILNTMSDIAPGAVAGIAPKTSSKLSASKSYQNKALDNYKKQIEYKKSLDQISLRDEINMYQTALNRYAKTTDEKMELNTKLYELGKELTEKTLDDYTTQIDYERQMGYISAEQEIQRYEYAYKTHAKTFEQKRDLELKIHDLKEQLHEETIQRLKEEADKEREMLNKKVEDYNNYIQQQKNLRGAEYDIKDQEVDLNKIIEMHRNYLNKIMKDERYSLEERENIYREELDIIRDYEQQKRDVRVSSVNNTVSQLKSAITKQIEEMEEADEKAIKKNIELVEEWKETRINAINEEYDARIETIQKELDALDKAEQQKSRDEEDAEYEKKKKRLEELVQYEHDAVTKANYEKELAKLIEEYQKTTDKRILEDKKEALKEQQDLLKEEQSNKVDKIQEEAEKQKEMYETQLDDLKEYYDKQKEMAQETAEKMLLNVDKNQQQILNLLNKYGDKYEITGQSLGEKLAQGINEGLVGKIQSIIQRVQDTIDKGIENQISKWTNAAYKYEQATAKAQTKTVQTNVTQNNYIQQNPEMPSETYRKLNNVSQNLAAEFAGM